MIFFSKFIVFDDEFRIVYFDAAAGISPTILSDDQIYLD